MTTVRRIGASSAAALFGVAVTIVLLSLFSPKWTKAAGLDVWEIPALQQQLETLARNDVAMNVELEENKNRFAFKQRLIDELIAERTSLKEVAAQFLAINRLQQSTTFAIHASYKGATDEEKTARNVIRFAALRTDGSFTQKVRTLAHLVMELRELTGDLIAESR